MAKKKKQELSTPGIGVAGNVMCPFGFQKGFCLKNGCEQWVELFHEKQAVGRCSFAWMPKLMIELRAEIKSLRNPLHKK